MIINLMMVAVTGLFTSILGLVPAYNLDGTMVNAGAAMGHSMGTANGIVPVGTIGACIAALVLARVFLMVWSLIVFLYDRVPFKAT